MLRKFLIFCLAFVSIIHARAQDSTAKGNLTLTGSVDAYYRFNFQNAKDSGRTNNFTSFTNSQNSFELGMASVKA
ncbi:MAG: porin, partial [Chitinophagales bacterium]